MVRTGGGAVASRSGGGGGGGGDDIAGGLLTAAHRDAHLRGRVPPAADLAGVGSCFDATVPSQQRPGAHPPALGGAGGGSLPRWSRALGRYVPRVAKPDPAVFLQKGAGATAATWRTRRSSGSGGGDDGSSSSSSSGAHYALSSSSPSSPLRRPALAAAGAAAAASPSAAAATSAVVGPPKAGALARRPNPSNTAFRKYYERGDLPVCVDHHGAKAGLKWKAPPASLDLSFYLPVFLDGCREPRDPCRFLAVRGTEDLLAAAGERVLPVIPQLILPLKSALNTRDPPVVAVALRLLQKLVACGGPAVGRALVPYYRQLVPVPALYMLRSTGRNLGDRFDYAQAQRRDLAELSRETLAALERAGGGDALVNLRYVAPQYEGSCRGGGMGGGMGAQQ